MTEEFKKWAYESYCSDLYYEWGDSAKPMSYKEFVESKEYEFYEVF